ncbi:protein SEMI-ROLLED LEAF 2 isoform X1 [Silene latifolia]|uniref:protein SEMI-ROLLED LEAF 2 isoform X1 n=1 Tax=Silene latifolia TaxID=37657 RepID=UPI003D7826EE
MGVISRTLFPACESMCVCCPALRSRSRQPVKRYKKLIADIFPKSPDGQANERKIVKLCEYAAKNPVRIPKITKYLEERLHKELRYGHVKIVSIIMEAYNKLICTCAKQMAYFAASLLTLSDELLDCSKQVSVQKAGCQTLTQFIYCQTDGTYAHNIGSSIRKLCMLAREMGEEHDKRTLRASSLQCLSAMVWYMAEFSHIFNDIDEIVQATLDNYEEDLRDEESVVQRHLWVNEVVRCEGQTGAGIGVSSACSATVRPPPERKNILSLTREEIENPRIWAQICLQRMSEFAKERTPARHLLEPMFVYFDKNRQWLSQQGLAVIVLCDMCYFMEVPEKQLVILNSVVRHLDHKNVAHDPALKSCIVQVAATLARQMRSGITLADVGCVVDLLCHLRKSLQATAGPIGEEDMNLNVHLQNSIESCLLEIAKGTNDPSPLFDLMVIALEKLAPAGLVARATLSSVLILAHVTVAVYSHLQQAFPETLLLQLLKAMLHQDIEARLLAHQIFAILLFPSTWRTYETSRWKSNSRSTSDSVTALLEKLQKEKVSKGKGMNGGSSMDDFKSKDFSEDESKQGWTRRNSPKFYKLTSIIDRNCGTNIVYEVEPCVMKLCEDQILQLLSGFWIQANLSDNSPSNFEAIAHSYCLTLISSNMKTTNQNLIVRFFQLPLSLRNVSVYTSFGKLPPTCRRSVFITSSAMLMFAARMYQILELNDILRSQAPCDADPYLGINEDLQVYVKPQVDLRQYGSALDNQTATSFFADLQDKNIESEKILLDIIVRYLCCIVKIDEEELLNQLSVTFSPDEAFMFAPKELRELDHLQIIGQLKDSPSLDGNLSISSVADDDVTSLFSAVNISGPKESNSPSHIMSIGQLLESALEVAGQVVATSVSTSPLPYSAVASNCEALETSTRKKLSNWLSQENISTGNGFELPGDEQALINKGSFHADSMLGLLGSRDQLSTLRLPPASPFDNFLRAVSGPQPVFAGLSA